MSALGKRLVDDSGLAPAEFVLFTGLVLLPTLILVASLPTWWERQSLGRLAAQEAARTVALAPDWDTGVAHGHQMVAQLAANHDVSTSDLTVAFAGSLERGQAVQATVEVSIPAMAVPFVVELPSFTLSFTHAELVDAYRSIPQT